MRTYRHQKEPLSKDTALKWGHLSNLDTLIPKEQFLCAKGHRN